MEGNETKTIKLSASADRSWQGRQHFLAAAAEAMRRILVDCARRRQAAKRGGDAIHLKLEETETVAPAADDHLLRLDEALAELASRDARKAELVRLRYFAGMTFEEAAQTLAITVPTAKQWWAYSPAWLRMQMAREESEE